MRFHDPNWRRTVLALAFAASGVPLLTLAIWLAAAVRAAGWPASLAVERLHILGTALYAVLALLALVLTGLSFSVALRQVSARFAGGEISARGGAGADTTGDAGK